MDKNFKQKNFMHNVVQLSIGYDFQNPDLIDQAFTRKSYSQENGGENNEVLEFIGDKALDLAVVKILSEEFSDYWQPANNIGINVFADKPHGEFLCVTNEGNLTRIKSQMVCKETLAGRIDELGYLSIDDCAFLKMGTGDIKKKVWKEASVKEDLFEAIIGAVAIDCKWDIKKIQAVVEAMLIPEDFFFDEKDNYVRLIYSWEEKNGVLPWFKFWNTSRGAMWYMPKSDAKIYQQTQSYYENYTCELKLNDDLPLFEGYGQTKNKARMNVCKLAYEYLENNDLLYDIRDEIDNPSRAQAINQLEILASRGYFEKPEYDFEQSYDADGNPIWKCTCEIAGEEYYTTGIASKKTEAKKDAAFEMLKYVLDMED